MLSTESAQRTWQWQLVSAGQQSLAGRGEQWIAAQTEQPVAAWERR